LQRKQVLEIENERAKTELQILKTSIQPDFIFQSLKSLKKNMENGFAESPKMILQLSDVLSYLLYDCNADFISLYQELSAVKEYILLEENITGYQFFIDINLKEELKKFSVVPSVLLSFLQDCFINLNNNDEKKLRIHVECSLQTDELFFLFSVSEVQKIKLSSSFYNEIINNFKSRLEKFYTNKYFLRTNFQDSLMKITLRLNLSESAAVNKAEQPEYEATV
jgi:LytS/YehU family sensor histidine kinase